MGEEGVAVVLLSSFADGPLPWGGLWLALSLTAGI